MQELTSARAVADEADGKRTAALVEAVGHLVPRPDLGPCPIAIPVVGSEAMFGNREPDNAPVGWRSIRANQMMVVDKAAVASTPSVRRKHIGQMLDFEQSRLNAPRPGNNIDAKLVDRDKFRSGLILGTAFVYSYVDERVACAGSVLAENSAGPAENIGAPDAGADRAGAADGSTARSKGTAP
jgi:hypothetical protein